jgi:hypothetical protein
MKSNVVSLTYQIELEPGEELSLPESLVKSLGAGRWLITIQPLASEAPIRDHTAFLNSYAPEDEGLYDDDVDQLTREAQAAISKGFYSAFLDSYAPEDEACQAAILNNRRR